MSRPEGCNYGDPNSFTTYTGGIMQMELAEGVTATSANVVLTVTNQVQFCGNVTLPEDAEYPFAAATLPEAVRPDEDVMLPCTVQLDDGTFHLLRLVVGSDGTISVALDFIDSDDPVPATVYLDSVSYDLASIRYSAYTET